MTDDSTPTSPAGPALEGPALEGPALEGPALEGPAPGGSDTGTAGTGAAAGGDGPPADPRPPLFVRPRDGRMVAGVCAGIAERWDLDITLVRIATVTLAVLSGIGVAAYGAAWLLTPSVDGPAPLRPGGRYARLATRLPVLVLVLLAFAVVGGATHALWFGAPVGLLVVAVVLALVIGTRRGRWLLTVVAVLIALGIATVGVFGSHFGTRSLHVANAADLRGTYDYGVGTVKLDLSDLQVTGRHRTDVHLGRGDVDVVVPAGVPVVVHARSGLGSVTVGGHEVGGLDAEQTQAFGAAAGSSADALVLDVTVGVGSVDVSTT